MNGEKKFDELQPEDEKPMINIGTFVCTDHSVREVIAKDTGESAGNKLFLNGVVMESGEKIEISQAIVIGRDGKEREAGLWVKEVAGRLRIGTTVSMLRFHKLSNISAVDGFKFNVVKNSAGYWVIKSV